MLYEFLEPLMDIDEAELGGGTDEEVQEEVQEEISEEIDEQPEEEERIPKAVFLAQKKELKALKKQFRELSEKEQDATTKKTIDKAIEKMAGRYDEEFVEVMRDFAESLVSSIPRTDKVTEEIMEDIRDLENSDAMKYKNEIIEKVKKFRKVGEELTVEEAYELVRIKKPHEEKLKAEQKELANRRRGTEPTSTVGSSLQKEKYNFTEKDKSALKQLQRLQPNAGWTDKKYYETMKRHADL